MSEQPNGKTPPAIAAQDIQPLAMGWGEIRWLVGQRLQPDSELTFGVVTIAPGAKNERHLHPNCEEVLYVISGECDHSLGDERYHLTPGMAIRVPRNTPHDAVVTSSGPLHAVIAYSAPDRRTVVLEPGMSGMPSH